MFTQKISMDCTREQYKKHLQSELLKIGYRETILEDDFDGIIVNNCRGILGEVSNVSKVCNNDHERTYLGQFNAPLFLALAAMTDNSDSGYGEWLIKKSPQSDNKDWVQSNGKSSFNEYWRKATVLEIMQKFSSIKEQTLHNKVPMVQDMEFIDPIVHPTFIKGEYYYVKLKNGNEWVFISKGEGNLTENFFSCPINSSNIYYSDGRVCADADIKIIHKATEEQKDILDKRMFIIKHIDLKKTTMKVHKVTREQLGKLEGIACKDWKPVIKEYAVKYGDPFSNQVLVPDDIVKGMFEAATKEQREYLDETFPNYYKSVFSKGFSSDYLKCLSQELFGQEDVLQIATDSVKAINKSHLYGKAFYLHSDYMVVGHTLSINGGTVLEILKK